jgi:hypothetical protein
MSSCPKSDDPEVTIDSQEIKKEREEEIRRVSKSFLMATVNNLCIMEGISGHIDAALEIDRRKVILSALIDLVKEMEAEYE